MAGETKFALVVCVIGDAGDSERHLAHAGVCADVSGEESRSEGTHRDAAGAAQNALVAGIWT